MLCCAHLFSVVCNQLGFGDAVRAYPMSHFGSARSVPIWLDEVRCTVRDMMLSECRRNVWGGSDCSHSEDAGVICSGRGMIYSYKNTYFKLKYTLCCHMQSWGHYLKYVTSYILLITFRQYN